MLEGLYTRTIVPPAVVAEMERGRSIGIDLPDLHKLPWVKIRAPRASDITAVTPDLGAGEKEVIALGIRAEDAVIILDDRLARSCAKTLKWTVTGTLGILLRAKALGRIARIEPLLDQLDSLAFHMSSATREAVLRQAGESATRTIAPLGQQGEK